MASSSKNPVRSCRLLGYPGDFLVEVDQFRDQPSGLFGPVASAATITRLLTQLAAERDPLLTAINQARSQVRDSTWETAGPADRVGVS
ncbi:MAG: hypothetical protein HLX51_14115 [Micrococcaceae bacterium]|nr:hypothetical protein [Micrococcaceae bacterium]